MSREQRTTEALQTRKTKWKKEQVFALVVACIPLLGFIIFNGFPLLISFIGMFCNVDLYDLTNIQWNNFEGFKSVFIPRHAYDLFYFDLAKYFYKAVIITVWIASTQLVTLLIALFVATLLHEKPNGAKLFQILFFIPYICSTVAVSLMWRWILDWEGGILNSLLGTDIRWLEDPKTITWCIIIAIIWQAPGYGIVMYKAAFSNINSALYEAAKIDGASMFQRIWNIDLPALVPMIIMQLIMCAGGIMNVGFEKVMLLQTELNKAASDVLAVYVYEQGNLNAKYSYSTAVGLFNTAINIVLLIVVNTISKKAADIDIV